MTNCCARRAFNWFLQVVSHHIHNVKIILDGRGFLERKERCTDQALVAGALLLQLYVENFSWDIRLFVWRKFHFFCGTAVSCICITQTTVFSRYRFNFIYIYIYIIYIYIYTHTHTHIYVPGVFLPTEEDTMQHGSVRVLM